MLSCFSFRYEHLNDDDYVGVPLNRSGRDASKCSTTATSTANSTTGHDVVVTTASAQQHRASVELDQRQHHQLDRQAESTIQLPSCPSKTRHLDRQRQLRKVVDVAQDCGQRYSRFPPTANSSSFSSPTSACLKTPVFNSPTSLSSSSTSLSISTSTTTCISTSTTLPRRRNVTPLCPSSDDRLHLVWRKMSRANDWSRNGSFFKKPTRGWLHPNQSLSEEGISYSVRYIGRLDVNASMKSLEFETRSQVAKECINRICEAGGLKTVDRKRRVDKKIARMLGDKPDMQYAGSNVNLLIASAHLKLVVMETGQVIASHDMPNVSFASGGDPETLDFVSYVAKDGNNSRACYVLECGGGLAQDVITTIGQAFELRFKEYLEKNTLREIPAGRLNLVERAPNVRQDDPEYYNDLPGKIPPPEPALPKIPPWPNYQNGTARRNSVDNLIDLSSEPSSPMTTNSPAIAPEYVNDCMVAASAGSNSSRNAVDPFDMQPFEEHLPDNGAAANVAVKSQFQRLEDQDWFHGAISRRTAELLLVHDGDFLVRESRGSPGQYVLSGMHKEQKKHLLLVDPQGVVRTKDWKFNNVVHLVEYHRTNRLPIISAESAMTLDNPISRRASTCLSDDGSTSTSTSTTTTK